MQPALPIVSDSTLFPKGIEDLPLSWNENDVRMLGGSGQIFSQLPGRIQAEILAAAVRRARDTGNVRVGYVPLEKCGQYQQYYSEYGQIQAETFRALAVSAGIDLVAVPSLEDFARIFKEIRGGKEFFPPKEGDHLAPPEKVWLQKALGQHGIDHGLSMILCLGWNCQSKRVLRAELAAQGELIKRVQRQADAGRSAMRDAARIKLASRLAGRY